MTIESEITMYQFTKIDYTHPNPEYRSRDHVTVHIDVANEEIVTGRDLKVTT